MNNEALTNFAIACSIVFDFPELNQIIVAFGNQKDIDAAVEALKSAKKNCYFPKDISQQSKIACPCAVVGDSRWVKSIATLKNIGCSMLILVDTTDIAEADAETDLLSIQGLASYSLAERVNAINGVELPIADIGKLYNTP